MVSLSFQGHQWLKMMSDASDMLAAALEQMDGIIAGKVLSQVPTSGVCVGNKGEEKNQKRRRILCYLSHLKLRNAVFLWPWKKLVLSTEGAGCPPYSLSAYFIMTLSIEAATRGSFFYTWLYLMSFMVCCRVDILKRCHMLPGTPSSLLRV